MTNFLSKRHFLISLSIVLCSILLVACGTTNTDDLEDPQTDHSNNEQKADLTNTAIDENPIVTITMENDDEIIVELYPNIAPNTVNNFVSLIEDKFYDGLIFHRVIPGFMIQGGDPNGIGTGGPGYGIKGEFLSNGFENDLAHNRGVISMARSGHPDSAGSQFFLMAANTPSLDGDYAAFGEVIEGIETVDKIVGAERDRNDKPLEDQTIKTMTVDTKGYDYPKPAIVE